MKCPWFTVLVLSAAVGCGPSGGQDDPQGGTADGGEGRPDAPPPINLPDGGPPERCDKMDIVFVIDDSGSMGQEQDNLAANFPQFIGVLDSFTSSAGQPIDYRVAVTTTGVSKSWEEATPIPGLTISDDQDGDDGAFRTGSGCNMPRRWLERADDDVAGKFSCVANVGTGGPPDEMPLAALKMALTQRVADGTNAGFLRNDALLSVVILTDENDCSREDNNFSLGFGDDICDDTEQVSTYLSMMDAVTGDRGRWAVAVIAGAGPGACSSALGDAAEATRLIDLANQTGDNAVVSSICEGDLAGALEDALETFDSACQQFPPID